MGKGQKGHISKRKVVEHSKAKVASACAERPRASFKETKRLSILAGLRVLKAPAVPWQKGSGIYMGLFGVLSTQNCLRASSIYWTISKYFDSCVATCCSNRRYHQQMVYFSVFLELFWNIFPTMNCPSTSLVQPRSLQPLSTHSLRCSHWNGVLPMKLTTLSCLLGIAQ